MDAFDSSGMSECKISIKDVNLEFKKPSAQLPQVAVEIPTPLVPQSVAQPTVLESKPVPSETENLDDCITAPMVGTCYFSPSPGASPFIKVGDKVKKGQTIAIIEAMKIMNELHAEFDCEIVQILCDDASAVDFGKPIFKIKKL